MTAADVLTNLLSAAVGAAAWALWAYVRRNAALRKPDDITAAYMRGYFDGLDGEDRAEDSLETR